MQVRPQRTKRRNQLYNLNEEGRPACSYHRIHPRRVVFPDLPPPPYFL